jgi:hypothetical protein
MVERYKTKGAKNYLQCNKPHKILKIEKYALHREILFTSGTHRFIGKRHEHHVIYEQRV